jgi:hypothetical protein
MRESLDKMLRQSGVTITGQVDIGLAHDLRP